MAQERTWPPADAALEIHASLCADDPVAPSDLANSLLDPLADWLRRTNPRIDPHLCDQAAADAILSLIKNPRAFNPDKSPLDAYLRMAARADLRNALEREWRHRGRRENLEVVELFGAVGNVGQALDDPALVVEREEEDREAHMHAIPLDIAQAFTPEEQRVFDLIVQGERRTDAFARALEIAHLPERDQRVEVKRIKDRIKRRLRRARGGT
jgi:DNA-directed RNA polymerase specialized sigma24 family protein